MGIEQFTQCQGMWNGGFQKKGVSGGQYKTGGWGGTSETGCRVITQDGRESPSMKLCWGGTREKSSVNSKWISRVWGGKNQKGKGVTRERGGYSQPQEKGRRKKTKGGKL